jgi:hypothetical protein
MAQPRPKFKKGEKVKVYFESMFGEPESIVYIGSDPMWSKERQQYEYNISSTPDGKNLIWGYTQEPFFHKLNDKKTNTMKKNTVTINDQELDCDDLAEREREQLAKRRKSSKKQAKKRESTKNVQRVTKTVDLVRESISDRIEKGEDIGKREIEGLIKRVEGAITELKELRKKAS